MTTPTPQELLALEKLARQVADDVKHRDNDLPTVIERAERLLAGLRAQAGDTEGPVLAFQRWVESQPLSRPMTQDEYFAAQAAFYAAHPGEGPTSSTMAEGQGHAATPAGDTFSANEAASMLAGAVRGFLRVSASDWLDTHSRRSLVTALAVVHDALGMDENGNVVRPAAPRPDADRRDTMTRDASAVVGILKARNARLVDVLLSARSVFSDACGIAIESLRAGLSIDEAARRMRAHVDRWCDEANAAIDEDEDDITYRTRLDHAHDDFFAMVRTVNAIAAAVEAGEPLTSQRIADLLAASQREER